MSGLNELMRSQIALLAGDDLEDEEQIREVRQSIESCPHCRQHWVRLRGCVDILDRAGQSAEGVDGVASPSLWPVIGSRLQRTCYVRRDRFNGWVPALSMAAACIALLVAGQMDGVSPQELPAVDQGGLFGGQMRAVDLAPPPPWEGPAIEGSSGGRNLMHDLSFRKQDGYVPMGMNWQR